MLRRFSVNPAGYPSCVYHLVEVYEVWVEHSYIVSWSWTDFSQLPNQRSFVFSIGDIEPLENKPAPVYMLFRPAISLK